MLLLSLLSSLFAYAQAPCTAPAWQDFHVDDVVATTQVLEFPRVNQETVVLDPASPYRVFNIQGLDGISVVLLTLRAEKCPARWSDASAEMILVDPSKEAGRDRSVGVQLNARCELEVFVETKDYGTCGLFADLRVD